MPLLFYALRDTPSFQEKYVLRAEQGNRWEHFGHCPRGCRGGLRCPSRKIHSVHPPAKRICENCFDTWVSGFHSGDWVRKGKTLLSEHKEVILLGLKDRPPPHRPYCKSRLDIHGKMKYGLPTKVAQCYGIPP